MSNSPHRTPQPTVNRDRLAADLLVALTAKFAVMSMTPNEAAPVAKLAFTVADAFIRELEARS